MLMNKINPQLEQDAWDKRKIFIFLLVLAFVVGVVAYAFRDQKLELGQIKGLKAQENKVPPEGEEEIPFTNFQNTFQDKFNDVKKEAENINVVEIASSSPQIQKVINDLKNLQNYPQNLAKDACFKICEGL